MRLTYGVAALIFSLLPACADDGAGAGGDDEAASSSSSSSGAAAPAGPARGTIGGQAFTPTSSLAHTGERGLDLLFTDSADVCADTINAKDRPNVTTVQIYGLAKLADGTWRSEYDDVKVARVGATCVVQEAGGLAARATEYDVTITDEHANPVVGTVNITFEDGSTFGGSFSAPTCSSTRETTSSCP